MKSKYEKKTQNKKEIQEILISLRKRGFTFEELNKITDKHPVVLSALTKHGSDYIMSLENSERLLDKLKKNFTL